MNISLTNHTRYRVIISVDHNEPILIDPTASIPYEITDTQNIVVAIRPEYESYHAKEGKILKNTYETFVLNSEYTMTGISEQSELHITREKINFEPMKYYDRYFITAENATIISESHQVSAENKMKQAFRDSRLFDFFITDPLIQIVTNPILSILIVVAAFIFLGLKGLSVAILGLYLLILLLNWLGGFLTETVLGSLFKTKKNKVSYNDLFENNYILSYYANPNREAYDKKRTEYN